MLGERGEQQPVDADVVKMHVEEMAGRGLRVLAFARKLVDSTLDTINHEHVADGLEFLGLQALIDPPRPEAILAVAAC